MTQADRKPVAESGLAAALSRGTEETDNLSYAARNARIVYSTYVVTAPASPAVKPAIAGHPVDEAAGNSDA